MTSPLQLPPELWLHVFRFLTWSDRLRVRATCQHFRQLVDKSRPLWRGFTVVLQHVRRYDRDFWKSLARKQVSRVLLRAGEVKHLKQLASWLPALEALRLDDWKEGGVAELKLFQQLRRLSITSCSVKAVDFLLPLRQLTQLSLCGVQLGCPAPRLLDALTQLPRLTGLQLHHDGGLRLPTLSGLLPHLPLLTHLSCTMITYKTLPADFFCPAPLTESSSLPLSHLELLNYDAVVTEDALLPLSRLCSLSVIHLYSVPGPTCHLQTWLRALPQLQSLSVHGGHPLAEFAACLPASLLSLSLFVELQAEDLQQVSARTPHLEHLHLEPWSSTPHLVGLLPQLFPHLRTLRIRHHRVSDQDFLGLQQLQQLDTLEILDPFHRPDPSDPGWVIDTPSPHTLQLISELQRLTNHRVQVLTRPHRDPLTCLCT